MSDDQILTDISRQLEDIKALLTKGVNALQIIAGCQTKALAMAEERAQARATAPAASSPAPKGDTLTTTGYVSRCGQKMKDGKPQLTKKEGRIWFVELDNGFKASVFREQQYKLLENAAGARRPVIIEYIESGQYKNIESIKFGAVQPPPAGGAAKSDPTEGDDW